MALAEAPKMRVMICGPRDFWSYFRVYCVVLRLTIEFWDEGYNLIIVQGEAKGVDTFAKRAAHYLGLGVESFPADWKKYGRAAGNVRNDEMLDTRPDIVVAIGTGRGTQHAIDGAIKRDIPVRRKSAWWVGKSARAA